MVGLRGKLCRPYGSELKIAAGAGTIRYPEAFVVCTPVAPRSTVVHEPVVVFEVLSDRSVETDLVTKDAEYQATPSIQRYFVLQQTSAAGMMFVRRGEDWLTHLLTDPDAMLAMPEVGLTIAMSEMYEGVAFEAAA